MPNAVTTRAVRFHAYGKPADVLQLEQATLGAPAPGHIRVKVHAGGDVDRVLDTAPPSGAIPELIAATGNRPQHVLSISDHQGAVAAGARDPMAEKVPMQYAAYAPFAKLAAEGKFFVPIARTYPLDRWREAMAASMGGKAHGKLIVLP